MHRTSAPGHAGWGRFLASVRTAPSPPCGACSCGPGSPDDEQTRGAASPLPNPAGSHRITEADARRLLELGAGAASQWAPSGVIAMNFSRGQATVEVEYTCTPIPVPATLGIIGIGALAMLLRRKAR